jgi:hypothetical protein
MLGKLAAISGLSFLDALRHRDAEMLPNQELGNRNLEKRASR